MGDDSNVTRVAPPSTTEPSAPSLLPSSQARDLVPARSDGGLPVLATKSAPARR